MSSKDGFLTLREGADVSILLMYTVCTLAAQTCYIKAEEASKKVDRKKYQSEAKYLQDRKAADVDLEVAYAQLVVSRQALVGALIDALVDVQLPMNYRVVYRTNGGSPYLRKGIIAFSSSMDPVADLHVKAGWDSWAEFLSELPALLGIPF